MYPVNILCSLRGTIGPEVYKRFMCFFGVRWLYRAYYFEKYLRHPILLGALADQWQYQCSDTEVRWCTLKNAATSGFRLFRLTEIKLRQTNGHGKVKGAGSPGANSHCLTLDVGVDGYCTSIPLAVPEIYRSSSR